MRTRWTMTMQGSAVTSPQTPIRLPLFHGFYFKKLFLCDTCAHPSIHMLIGSKLLFFLPPPSAFKVIMTFMKDCLERWVSWILKAPRGVPSPRVAIMKEKLVLPLPSGIHWNIKGLSQEPLWALAISTDMTFGCQWQFYDSLYSCDQNRDVEVIPLSLRRRELVSQAEGARNHTPLSSSRLS